MPTSTTENRNGSRQPQVRKPGPDTRDDTYIARFASTRPIGDPMKTQAPYQPQRPGGACSTAISDAPPCSPPMKKPCTTRSNTSSRGAAMPIEA